MSSLVLELRQGEMAIINGVTIRFRTKARIELLEHVRFLFGRQIMSVEDAKTSAAKSFYYACQQVYVGPEGTRASWLVIAQSLAEGHKSRFNSALTHELLDKAVEALESDVCYTALKIARRIIRHEDTLAARQPIME